MKNHQLINQNSGKVEYYTPTWIVEAARRIMGSIELDPASNPISNKFIKAQTYYTKEDDGLSLPWFGNVFLNPPFGKPKLPCKLNCKLKGCIERGYCIEAYQAGIGDWLSLLDQYYKSNVINQAVVVTFNNSASSWFRFLVEHPQCILYNRVNYTDSLGEVVKGVTRDTVITYLGSNLGSFYDNFKEYGTIKTMYRP